MSDYVVAFELDSGQLQRTRLSVDECCYTVISEPAEAQLHSEKIHFSSIKEIESTSPAQLKLITCDNKVKTFTTIDGSSDDIIQLAKCAVVALASVYPMVPFERLFTRIHIHPAERLQNLLQEHSAAVRDTNYAADDTQDAGNNYLERTFSLSDFRMRCSAENGKLLMALQHNTWFNYFYADETKLTDDEVKYIGCIIRSNVVLKGIDLSNTGLTKESLQEIAFALTVNSASSIVDIDLSNNKLGEQGISTLSAALLNLPRGFRRLNLETTGMTPNFASKYLFKALFSNAQHASTLQSLELGGFANGARHATAIENILIFLAIPNSLQELDLSGGNMDLVKIVGSLQSGCLAKLTVLNLSGNVYKADNSADPPEHWRRFFMNASSIEIICLSKTMLSASALRNLLIGLSHNEQIEQGSRGIHLDISHNNLGTTGADILIAVAPDLKNIHSLDVTNNGFEREVTRICESLMQNQSLRHLSIGQNFSFPKQKAKEEALNAMKSLMQSEQSVLESIDVSDSNLGKDTLIIISALENCTKIKKIDLRGNNMGDDGASKLARILHTSAALTWISFDCNNISTKGLREIARVLERKPPNCEVVMPTKDITRAAKKDTLKANKSIASFLMAIFVNRQPQRPQSLLRHKALSESSMSLTKKQQRRTSQREACSRSSKELECLDISERQPNYDTNESSFANEATLKSQSDQQSINTMPLKAFSASDDPKRRSTEREASEHLAQLNISEGEADNSPASLNATSENTERESSASGHYFMQQIHDASSTGSS